MIFEGEKRLNMPEMVIVNNYFHHNFDVSVERGRSIVRKVKEIALHRSGTHCSIFSNIDDKSD